MQRLRDWFSRRVLLLKWMWWDILVMFDHLTGPRVPGKDAPVTRTNSEYIGHA